MGMASCHTTCTSLHAERCVRTPDEHPTASLIEFSQTLHQSGAPKRHLIGTFHRLTGNGIMIDMGILERLMFGVPQPFLRSFCAVLGWIVLQEEAAVVLGLQYR